jgi:hypothetical protein
MMRLIEFRQAAGVNRDEPRIHQVGISFSFFHDFQSFGLRAETGRI